MVPPTNTTYVTLLILDSSCGFRCTCGHEVLFARPAREELDLDAIGALVDEHLAAVHPSS